MRMQRSSAEKTQKTEFPEGKNSVGGGTALFSQHTVIVWPLHSRSQMTWSCLVLLKCSKLKAWLSCLSMHGQVKKDHGTGLGTGLA